jgi:hypothetical protein
MATLSEYGFDPELEAPAALSASVQVTNEHEPSFARIQLSEPRRGFSFESFERFDELALIQWFALRSHFRATMELGDEQLERLMLRGPDDYENREEYECDLDDNLSYSIRPIFLWRAVRLGCQVGRFMSAFAATFADRGDLWLTWRRGEVQNSLPVSVRAVDREMFLLALLARNLLSVRSWPAEDEGVL